MQITIAFTAEKNTEDVEAVALVSESFPLDIIENLIKQNLGVNVLTLGRERTGVVLDFSA